MVSCEQDFYELLHYCIESNGYILIKSDIAPGFCKIKKPKTDEARSRVLDDIIVILTTPTLRNNDERIAMIKKLLYKTKTSLSNPLPFKSNNLNTKNGALVGSVNYSLYLIAKIHRMKFRCSSLYS